MSTFEVTQRPWKDRLGRPCVTRVGFTPRGLLQTPAADAGPAGTCGRPSSYVARGADGGQTGGAHGVVDLAWRAARTPPELWRGSLLTVVQTLRYVRRAGH